jgi:hypothetical protein
MARQRAVTKTSTTDGGITALPSRVERYCRGLDGWPRSWMGLEADLLPGRELVACFRPFLEHLVDSDLSPKTIQKHVDNLWVLGGEIIRDLHEDPRLRKLPAERILRNAVNEDGGLLIHNGSEEEQRSLDSTCRRFHRFLLTQQPRPAARGKT